MYYESSQHNATAMAVARIAAVTLLLLSGCADRTPARIEHDVLPELLTGSEPVSLNPRVLNQASERLPDIGVTVAAIPTTVLEATPAGVISCRDSGDGVVTLSGGGLSALVNVKCRLVSKITMEIPPMVILDDGPVSVRAQAFDKTGRLVEDTPIEFSSSEPSVFAAHGPQLIPSAIGKASLSARVGKVVSVQEVTVAQRLVTASVALSDGQIESRTLTRGNYLVDVNVAASDGSAYGVTLSWTGTACENQSEAQKHRVTCQVAETASLVLNNPTTFGMGPAEMGNITIMRIP